MTTTKGFAGVVAALVAAGLGVAVSQTVRARGDDVAAPRSGVVDTWHGATVLDAYRALEDVTSAATRRWIEEQDARTVRALESHPDRERLLRRLEAVMRFTVLGAPVARGGRYFYTRQEPGQERPVLVVQEGLRGAPRILVDANALPDRTLAGFVPSPDGRLVAYGLARPGSSWARWRIRDLDAGKDLADELVGLRATPPSWTADARLVYAASPEPRPDEELTAPVTGQRVFLHRLGDPISRDVVVYERAGEEGWFTTPTVSDDGRNLFLAVRKGSSTRNRLLFKRLAPDAPVAAIADGDEAAFTFVASDGDEAWIQTDLDAPRGRVVALDLRHPRGPWRTIVPEAPEALSSVAMVADRLLAIYLRDAVPTLRVFDRGGRLQREQPFPHLGTTFSGFTGRRTDHEAFFTLNSVALPPSPYRLDPRAGSFAPFLDLELPFQPDDFVLEQVFYTARDGTRIPMFLARKRDAAPSGPRPALAYGYGAFGWPAFPWFQPHVLVWLEEGGLYALPGIRGGGEYGDAWHRAGMRQNKQRSVDDFVDALEWLVARGYTSRERLAVNGGSFSGLLAGAVAVQRPDLVGAALLDIPVLDLLRFDRFTAGARWEPELGTPSDPEAFRVLRALSPYHNVKPGVCYPATLVTAGERDGTAMPAHAYKFAAALQAAQACPAPVLLKVAWGAGHAVGATPAESRRTWALQLAFLRQALGPSRPLQ
jgi:prolyl oligopeptidase